MTRASSRQRWWIGVLLGLAAAAAGAVLLVQPFDSLATLTTVIAAGALLLSISSFVESRSAATRWPGLVAAVVWAGVAVGLVTSSVTTAALALLVGVALIVNGALDIIAGVRGTTDERLASGIGGAASIVFGALAVAWPSVTALVIAVVFGFKLMLFGLRLTWSSIRSRGDAPRQADATEPKGRVRRLGLLVGTAVALVLALVLAGVSAQLNEGQPIVDSFYDPPGDVPDDPGQLLAVEPFDRAIPDGADAWRIRYTTTRGEGEPALASAIVVVPEHADGPLPTIALAHGTTGVDRTWTGGLAPDDAPDVGVIGVAALAPASDAVGLAENLSDVTGGTIFSSYLVQGYANAYDDVEVDDDVRDAARASFDATVDRWLAEPSALLSVIGAVTIGSEVFAAELNSGALGERLEQNVASLPIEAPLLLAQGEADRLVAPAVQEAYVEARCAAGQPIDYRTYPDLDHVPLVEATSPLLPELMDWTRDRFDDDEPTPTC